MGNKKIKYMHKKFSNNVGCYNHKNTGERSFGPADCFGYKVFKAYFGL